MFQGETLSPGRAVGRLHLVADPPTAAGPGATARDPTVQAARFSRSVEALTGELDGTASQLEAQGMTAEAGILRAHVMMLEDRGFQQRVRRRIEQEHAPAESAVNEVLEETAERLEAAGDEALAERSADLRDLARRLGEHFAGSAGGLGRTIETLEDPVVAATELTASMVIEARAAGARGFVVARGTGVSHGAILAKSFGLPAVRLPSLDTLREQAGRLVLVDGAAGRIVVDPGEADRATGSPGAEPAYRKKPLPARLWLNVVDPEQLAGVDWRGIEGVGLYRTEVLFMQHREGFPDEDEQLAAYRTLFEHAGGRPVVVRTADLGADKPIPHMSLGPQQNPFLGLRAHRLFRFHPEIFVTQVRAILRAAAGPHRLRLMFPMLESPDAWQFLQRLVREAVRDLRDRGLAYQSDFEQGVLIETPSAALSFDALLQVVDFASVGTNDLVQYLFAVERDSANVADLYQPEHPIVLRLLRSLAGQAARAGKPLSICGETAADPELAPVLVGLGIENLSVAPPRLDDVRRALAGQTRESCRKRAERCLAASGIEEVRRRLGRPPRLRPDAAELPAGHAVDPVCGMVLGVADAPFSLERGSTTHYFCSRRCRERFREGEQVP